MSTSKASVALQKSAVSQAKQRKLNRLKRIRKARTMDAKDKARNAPPINKRRAKLAVQSRVQQNVNNPALVQFNEVQDAYLKGLEGEKRQHSRNVDKAVRQADLIETHGHTDASKIAETRDVVRDLISGMNEELDTIDDMVDIDTFMDKNINPFWELPKTLRSLKLTGHSDQMRKQLADEIRRVSESLDERFKTQIAPDDSAPFEIEMRVDGLINQLTQISDNIRRGADTMVRRDRLRPKQRKLPTQRLPQRRPPLRPMPRPPAPPAPPPPPPRRRPSRATTATSRSSRSRAPSRRSTRSTRTSTTSGRSEDRFTHPLDRTGSPYSPVDVEFDDDAFVDMEGTDFFDTQLFTRPEDVELIERSTSDVLGSGLGQKLVKRVGKSLGNAILNRLKASMARGRRGGNLPIGLDNKMKRQKDKKQLAIEMVQESAHGGKALKGSRSINSKMNRRLPSRGRLGMPDYYSGGRSAPKGAKSRLALINGLAKRLRAEHPRMSWQSALKQAGAMYRRAT